jgi:hypothetical protein
MPNVSPSPWNNSASNWENFYEIWYFNTFRISVEKIQILLKSDKNNGHFTWRPEYILSYFAHFSLKLEMLHKKICRDNQNTYFIFNNFFFENLLEEIMWKNNVLPEWPQTTLWLMLIHAGYLRLQTHIHSTETYCFSTATMVARARLNITLYVYSCLVSLTLRWKEPRCRAECAVFWNYKYERVQKIPKGGNSFAYSKPYFLQQVKMCWTASKKLSKLYLFLIFQD